MLRVRAAPGSGLRVSELALGTLTFGREADERTSAELLDRFLDAGGTLVDTADSYHVAEEVLGRLLPSRRDRCVLATKVGLPVGGVSTAGLSRLHIRRECERSLRRLCVDHLDLYQLHLFDPFTPLEETLSAMDDLVREGKVRYVGLSNWTAWQAAKADGLATSHGWDRAVSVSPEYSLVSRGAERELLPLAAYEGLAVLPWAPLGGGLLSGKYRSETTTRDDERVHQQTTSGASLRRRLRDERNQAIVALVAEIAARHECTAWQVALAWVLGNPVVTSAIVGVRTVAQLEDNLGAARVELLPEELTRLAEASAIELGYPHEWNRAYGIKSPVAGTPLS